MPFQISICKVKYLSNIKSNINANISSLHLTTRFGKISSWAVCVKRVLRKYFPNAVQITTTKHPSCHKQLGMDCARAFWRGWLGIITLPTVKYINKIYKLLLLIGTSIYSMLQNIEHGLQTITVNLTSKYKETGSTEQNCKGLFSFVNRVTRKILAKAS